MPRNYHVNITSTHSSISYTLVRLQLPEFSSQRKNTNKLVKSYPARKQFCNKYKCPHIINKRNNKCNRSNQSKYKIDKHKLNIQTTTTKQKQTSHNSIPISLRSNYHRHLMAANRTARTRQHCCLRCFEERTIEASTVEGPSSNSGAKDYFFLQPQVCLDPT